MILDAHHHIWRLDRTPWLQGPEVPRIFGAYEPLRRDYSIEEYLSDAQPCGVVKSVFVQVNVAPREEVEEALWVQSVADTHGFPHGITAFADLAAPDVSTVLDRLVAAGNVRAIRQQLHWHENPQYRFAARPDVMNDAAWRAGLTEVGQRGLLFELQVFPEQMADAFQLALSFPNTTFILLHAGMLVDRTQSGWDLWRQGMSRLAACPNVVVKLSGLGTFERACREESWKPLIERTIDIFGTDRCLFGSNFPIEKLWTSYAQLIEVFQACLVRYSGPERRAILHDNASRIYRV